MSLSIIVGEIFADTHRPRAAAGAEVFWTHPDPETRTANADDALYRMHDIRYRLVDRGVHAAALQPLWCAVRPGKCNV